VNQRLLAQRMDGQALPVQPLRDRQGRHVEPPRTQAGEHLLGVLLAQLHLDRRIVPAVHRQHLSQLHHDPARRAQPDPAAYPTGPTQHLLLDRHQIGEDPLRVLQQGRPGRCQRHAVVVPLEEHQPQLPFQPADLLRQRRLRHTQRLGRPGEMQLPGDGLEVLQLP
jgi:hypothetical protein